jgi:hypothetical protein
MTKREGTSDTAGRIDSNPATPVEAPAPVSTVEPASSPLDYDGLLPLPGWPFADYANVVAGPGAEKLADSSVAPLVAAARGYRHVEDADIRQLQAALKLGQANTAAYRNVVQTLEKGGGAMLMPRYLPDVAARYREGSGAAPFISTAEFRPVYAIDDPNRPGKVMKYRGIASRRAIMDVHPATPPEWFDHTPLTVITEGVIKGDAGMTALLRHAGVSDDDLAAVPATQAEAMDRLRALLRAVPAEQQALIISLGGVANGHSNPEWSDFVLKGRAVWLAFDGDVRTNRNVHSQAGQIWRKLADKGAKPMWLDLSVVRGDGGQRQQTGLDDYLSKIGPWRTLLSHLKPALPERPAKSHDDADRGDWRITEDGLRAEERVAWTDPSTGATVLVWKPRIAIGGRIKSIVASRLASDAELATATISDDEPAHVNVEVEVAWFDEEAESRRTAVITGPAVMLAEPPSEWHRSRVKATIPAAVLCLESWPPPMQWLEAAKSHRRSEIERTTQWEHMGWVPTVSPGEPAFVVGRQAVASNGFTDRAVPGVTDRDLEGANMFGVSDPGSDDALREAIGAVLDTYLAAWTDPRHAAAIMALGLRPTVPLVCETPAAFIGPQGTAKSWSAAADMAFWQPTPNTWSPKRLPGSASDTVTSAELAVSRTPIWVIDDLAPGPDARAENRAADALNKILRSVHNRTGKRRATATMGTMETFVPRAVVIVTAENNRFTGSVESRYILLSFAKGALDDEGMQQLVWLNEETTKASMITFAAIRMFASFEILAMPDPGDPTRMIPFPARSWEAVLDVLKEQKSQFAEQARAAFPGATPREWGVAADICLGLYPLEMLCRLLGLPDRAEQVRSLYALIISLTGEHVASQRERTPGASLLEAIRSVLAAGQAHIASGEATASTPIVGQQNSNLTASMLGWQPDSNGGMRATGSAIGYLVKTADDDPIVMLDSRNAFNVAAKNNRDLIMFGQTALQAWTSVWSEGLACEDAYTRQKTPNGALRQTVRASVGGNSISGIPVRLSVLLSGGRSTNDDTDT